jgi:hypothetical protein
MKLPPFRLGLEYAELHPDTGHRRWRWMLKKDIHIRLPTRLPDCSFQDAQGREWLQHDIGWRILRAGYWWNGCSPKRWLPLVGWVGTPDTPRNLLASCIHDAAYQFSGTPHWPTPREFEDQLFRDILRASGFRLTGAWYGAVKDFGSSSWGKNPDNLSSRPMA